MFKPQESQTKAGVVFAISAYTMWGVAPLYFKALSNIAAFEVLMHRVVWSALVLLILILGLKYIGAIKRAFAQPKVLAALFFAGILLAGNWLLFIWAVNKDYLLEASLGYYINPLINVFLGCLFLGEQLRKLQKIAVAIALCGVLILLVNYGQLPWIALTLALSFSVYGLIRKQLSVDSIPGLFIETLMMLPFALVYWVYFADVTADMTSLSTQMNVLLIAAGIVTTAPLLCFTAAARRIRYSTLGFFQYIGPSIMFILAVFLYKEPLSPIRLLSFICVWFALFIFTLDSYRAFLSQQKIRQQKIRQEKQAKLALDN